MASESEYHVLPKPDRVEARAAGDVDVIFTPGQAISRPADPLDRRDSGCLALASDVVSINCVIEVRRAEGGSSTHRSTWVA